MSKKSNPDLLLGIMMLGILVSGVTCLGLACNHETSIGQAIASIAAAISFIGGLQVLINFSKN